jgi:hypothetical protein
MQVNEAAMADQDGMVLDYAALGCFIQASYLAPFPYESLQPTDESPPKLLPCPCLILASSIQDVPMHSPPLRTASTHYVPDCLTVLVTTLRPVDLELNNTVSLANINNIAKSQFLNILICNNKYQ